MIDACSMVLLGVAVGRALARSDGVLRPAYEPTGWSLAADLPANFMWSSMQTLPLRIEKAAIRISSMRPE